LVGISAIIKEMAITENGKKDNLLIGMAIVLLGLLIGYLFITGDIYRLKDRFAGNESLVFQGAVNESLSSGPIFYEEEVIVPEVLVLGRALSRPVLDPADDMYKFDFVVKDADGNDAQAEVVLGTADNEIYAQAAKGGVITSADGSWGPITAGDLAKDIDKNEPVILGFYTGVPSELYLATIDCMSRECLESMEKLYSFSNDNRVFFESIAGAERSGEMPESQVIGSVSRAAVYR